MVTRMLLVLAALGLSAPAWALDPFMWGVGPRIGTIAIPAQYPIKFSKKIEDHLDAGNSTLKRVRTDVTVGAEGVYYLDSFSRMALDVGMGFATRFIDGNVLVKYDYVARAGAMDFLFGGGLGFGSQTFKGDGTQEKLAISYFPIKAEIAALLRDNSRGYQGSVFLLYNLPQNHFYTRPNGTDEDVGQGFYLAFGVELSVMFGDFTPPRKK